jgi:hypothetical protein
MTRPRAIISLIVLLCSGSLPCWPQTRPSATAPPPTVAATFSIRGNVRNNETNQPMEMVRVDLRLFTGEIVAMGFTRSNGEFEFQGLRNGMYYLIVEVNGFDPIRENIEIQNFSRPGVMVFLKKIADVRKPTMGPAVSSHVLSLSQKTQDAYQKGLERLYDKNDAQGSLQFFERAIAEASTCYEAYYEVGVAHARMGQTDEAVSAFTKSVEVSQGRFARAHIGLAAVLSNNSKYAEAEPSARRAVELDATQWEALFELARAQAGLNRWPEAEKSARATLQLNPKAAAVYLLLANVHIHKPDYPALIEDLEAYLKIEPQGASATQAHSTIDQVRRLMASAKNSPTPEKPQP